MTTKKIYGPPIKWDGGECPVPENTLVRVKFRDRDSESEDIAGVYRWTNDGDGADIVSYCTITEQSDLEAAEKLLREKEIEMSTKKIYGPPIKWDGGECPVPRDQEVMVKLRSGVVRGPGRAVSYLWAHHDDNSDIVEYCVVLEQADLDAAEKLLLDYGYTVTPPAKPLTFDDVVPMTEAPPKDTIYWAVQPFVRAGVEQLFWDGDDIDKCVLRYRVAYLEKEHALIAAQHIYGLKGGEL